MKAAKSYGLVVDVFSYCNLRCPTCIVGAKFGAIAEWPKGLMSVEKLEAILDKALGEFDVQWVCLYNWTEPLLHPRLPELVAACAKRGLATSLSSNLNVRPDYDFERLLAAGPSDFRISVSGFTQPIYERGHAGGDIERVKANMAALARAWDAAGAAPERLHVFYHVYAYNMDEIDPMKAYCDRLGVRFTLGYAQVFPVEKIVALAGGDASADDAALLDTLAVPLPRALAMVGSAERKCRLLEDVVTIDVAGNVMLCCGTSMNRANAVGAFAEMSIEAIDAAKSRHPQCRSCLKLNIPRYFAYPPELNAVLAEKLAAAGVKTRLQP